MADFGATYRLNYSGRAILLIIVSITFAILFELERIYLSFASPIDWVTLDMTVVIIFLMLIDPIINGWNAPRLKIDFRTEDISEGAKRRFSFDVVNTGRKAAINTRMELRLLLIDVSPTDYTDHRSERDGFVIFENLLVPPLRYRTGMLAQYLPVEITCDSSKEVRIGWLRETTSGDSIKGKWHEEGPLKATFGEWMISLTWNYKDDVEHIEKTYHFAWNKGETLPTMTEMRGV